MELRGHFSRMPHSQRHPPFRQKKSHGLGFPGNARKHCILPDTPLILIIHEIQVKEGILLPLSHSSADPSAMNAAKEQNSKGPSSTGNDLPAFSVPATNRDFIAAQKIIHLFLSRGNMV